MFTLSLIQATILAYHAAFCGHGVDISKQLNEWTMKQLPAQQVPHNYTPGPSYYDLNHCDSSEGLVQNIPPAPQEKVVIRETTMSDKYGLGVETITRPDTELAALQADAGRLKASIALPVPSKDAAWDTPNLHPHYSTNWNKQFSLTWEDDGGFRFGEKYYPNDPKSQPGERFSAL